MPSAVTMDNGGHDGSRTDHERDPKVNGAAPGKGKELVATINGSTEGTKPADKPTIYPGRMNDLPDEIIHITQGFIPLSLLLTRLAQKSHNSLQETIEKLARMPLKSSSDSAAGPTPPLSPDEASAEMTQKKVALLTFAQEQHAKWVKALVITEWSRKADMVSKLIDLKAHLDQQRIQYDIALDKLVNVKRDLTYARLPSPDLKTALQILSTGQAPYMPDYQYIEPPPLTIDEQLKWVNELNTLLSLRLNLDEFDKIPPQFRNYQIESGRVTFKVKGEFEVDLTIADEDFEKQFWFIDFRFAFKPATISPSKGLIERLESCVNDVLSRDGLLGCYQFLHELVLTQKIKELQRQALNLSKNAWTGTLMVEPLNRALAIQYWTSRTPPQAPKSWVLVAVSSGRKQASDKPSSHLVAKWYRDNQEVQDFDVPLDVENISAEDLLKAVVGRHIEFVLRGIHNKLLEAPRFKNREAGMVLKISKDDPASSSLTTQIGYCTNSSLVIEPMTGLFTITPHSKVTAQVEHKLNNARNQVEEGVKGLENVRCVFMEDDLNRRGVCMGWQATGPQMTSEEIRSITKKREWSRTLFLQRKGWGSGWVVVIFLSVSGDDWWLVESNRGEAKRFQAKLPLNKGHPDLSDRFWQNLTSLTTGMISQAVDLRELHRQKVKHRASDAMSSFHPGRIGIPAIDIELSALFPTMVQEVKESPRLHIHGFDALDEQVENVMGRPIPASSSLSSKTPWAKDLITISFKGVHPPPPRQTEDDSEDALSRRLVCVFEAVITARQGRSLGDLKGKVDRDVSYNPNKRQFTLRLRHPVAESTIPILKSKLLAVDRFVSFLEAFDESKGTITSESATLNQVSCIYRETAVEDAQIPQHHLVLDLSNDKIHVKLDQSNPHLRVIDLVQRLVNFPGGIRALMSWLPSSLPALAAIASMEEKWEPIQDQSHGEVMFTFKTLDWIGIRYTLGAAGNKNNRHLSLECTIRLRRGEPWWHIWRAPGSTDDVFTPVLKSIWNGQGEGWQGLRVGAAGRATGGVHVLLAAVDEAVRGMIAGPPEVIDLS